MKKADEFADAAALHYDAASGEVDGPDVFVTLAVKTKAGYSTNSVSAAEVKSAQMAHLALLDIARATR